MSGGYFNHEQYAMARIADDIEVKINGWFGNETERKFTRCVFDLRKTLQMVNLIDYLLSGDIDEADLERKWKEYFG